MSVGESKRVDEASMSAGETKKREGMRLRCL